MVQATQLRGPQMAFGQKPGQRGFGYLDTQRFISLEMHSASSTLHLPVLFRSVAALALVVAAIFNTFLEVSRAPDTRLVGP